MQVVRTINELRSALGDTHPTPPPRGGAAFVPTMGALHAGHAALIRHAKALVPPSTPVVVSIFVNPTQFGPQEDFSRYPRTFEADATVCAQAGATIIFAPEVATMYPPNEHAVVPDLPAVATQPQLEDAHRPSHFAGVCQVVARLFDVVQPARAIFGEKDYQQLLVIKAMVDQANDRWPDLQIIAHPTVREPDGLAMSSRNTYLRLRERDHALGLFRALRAAAQTASPTARHGESSISVTALEEMMRQVLIEHSLKIDYAVVRDARTLLPLDSLTPSGAGAGRPARALIAVRLGAVRLIDNMAIGDSV